MKKILMTMVVVMALTAMAAQAAQVDFSFDETSSGNWEVSVLVTGTDTAGLAGYALRVLDTVGVSYAEELSSILSPSFVTVGMVNPTASYIGVNFVFGNFQVFGPTAIEGIGMSVIDMDTPPGPTPAHLHYGVPALLGTLTTPEGLDEDDFAFDGSSPAGLLGPNNESFVSAGEIEVTMEVIPIPEPATMLVLLGAGLLAVIRRR